jgi:hypothetical protein
MSLGAVFLAKIGTKRKVQECSPEANRKKEESE